MDMELSVIKTQLRSGKKKRIKSSISWLLSKTLLEQCAQINTHTHTHTHTHIHTHTHTHTYSNINVYSNVIINSNNNSNNKKRKKKEDRSLHLSLIPFSL